MNIKKLKNSSIGIVGCGLMGSAIAKTFSSAGMSVSAWNRSPEAARALIPSGVTAHIHVSELVQASEIIVVVLSNYVVTQSVFDALDPLILKDKTLINLTSGSASEAEEMEQWALERNIKYLDGTIWTLPSEIGKPQTRLTYSGDSDAWQSISNIMLSLGGASVYLGDKISAANVMEAAFPGGFYMTALASFLEGIAIAKEAGVDNAIISSSVIPALELLKVSIENSIKKIQLDDFEADQATLDVCLSAATGYRHTLDHIGFNSPLQTALLTKLKNGNSQGVGDLDISALVKLESYYSTTKI